MAASAWQLMCGLDAWRVTQIPRRPARPPPALQAACRDGPNGRHPRSVEWECDYGRSIPGQDCAAQLEMMRLRFRGLGLSQDRVTGAYQGQFLFIQPEGVFTAQSYNGYHYPFMVRTGDGRLAVPGAMPQGQ